MTSDTLHETLEQNRENLKRLLEALDVDDSVIEDPEKKARAEAFFGASPERIKEAEMSEDERLAWMFEQNAKAIRDAAKAAGVPERKLNGEATDPVKNSNFTLLPKKAARRMKQRKTNREEKNADTDTSGFLDPRED